MSAILDYKVAIIHSTRCRKKHILTTWEPKPINRFWWNLAWPTLSTRQLWWE